MSDDDKWMQLALELAERGRGFVEPNPLVGAVVVRAGQLIAQGWHQRYGEDHAEVNALAAAGEAARGATLYVTLEPCCHFGKTPPCTNVVMAAGIRRVVAAMLDPFPPVAGKGAAELRKAGIEVVAGVGAERARRQNAAYLKLLQQQRPYVHAKWAMTLDGKIATRSGDSKWISSTASRRRVHELRGRMDAIIVGIGTVLADDPMLTARPPGPRVATRVVLDSMARTPAGSHIVQSARLVPTLIATSAHAAHQNVSLLREGGCEVVSLPGDPGRERRIHGLLDELGRRRMTNVLVEGGGEILGSFFDAAAVDEVHVFIAPRIVGGRDAKLPVLGAGVERIVNSLCLADCSYENIAGDLLLHGFVR